uniref:PGG domain-containing protein n=1 Tax=Manihot esculenta TaxID=3983 RepID=A0A2C9VNK7_MANES
MIDKLLDKWSSLTRETDEKGWTPLHYAVYKGYTSMVEKLLEKDESSAYISDKDWKRTPLHIAACRGLHHQVDKIISRCPNCCELLDIRGWNVLHYAVISQSDKLLRTLLKHSSLVYLLYGKDIKGNMPVHLYKAYHPLTIKLGFDKPNLFFHWGELYSQVPGYSSSEKRKTHLVASTLIATITFAGAFTIPGGYISDEKSLQKGTPVLSKNLAFNAFIISDFTAMLLSTGAVSIHLALAILKYRKGTFWLIKCAYISLVCAMVAMLIAFVTGTCSFLTPSVGIYIRAIGLIFFLFLYGSMMRIMHVQ